MKGAFLWTKTQELHSHSMAGASVVCFLCHDTALRLKNLEKFFAWSCNSSSYVLAIPVSWLRGHNYLKFYLELDCFKLLRLSGFLVLVASVSSEFQGRIFHAQSVFCVIPVTVENLYKVRLLAGLSKLVFSSR